MALEQKQIKVLQTKHTVRKSLMIQATFPVFLTVSGGKKKLRFHNIHFLKLFLRSRALLDNLHRHMFPFYNKCLSPFIWKETMSTRGTRLWFPDSSLPHMFLSLPLVPLQVLDNDIMLKLERKFLHEVPPELSGLLEPVTDPEARLRLLSNTLIVSYCYG